MTLPRLDFAVVGAGKCGTTTLYRVLRDHPEVFLPRVKETNFFALRGRDLDDGGPDPEQARHWPTAVTDDDAWSALFADAAPHQVRGEVCPMYLYTPHALRALAELQPDLRVVVILRDPVKRLWSRFLHLAREDRSPAPFEDVLDPTSIWWRRPDLIWEGRYADHLAQLARWFPRDRVSVLLFDDLVADPSGLLARLARVLDLRTPLEAPRAAHNASGHVRSPIWQRVVGRGGLVSALGHCLPGWLREHRTVRAGLENLRARNLQRVSCPPDLRRALLDRVYRAQVQGVEDYLGRDLGHWRAAA